MIGGFDDFKQRLEVEADDVEQQFLLVLVIVVEVGFRYAGTRPRSCSSKPGCSHVRRTAPPSD